MSSQVECLIKQQYHTYRHTPDVHEQGLFFSPTCMQTCRSNPSYCATSRDQIVQYLLDAKAGNIHSSPSASDEAAPKPKPSSQSRYTIRPLEMPAELEFGDSGVTKPIGYDPEELVKMAEKEGWVGMRVDLWDEGEGEEGLCVKVNYWWREEDVKEGEEREGDVGGKGWRQCFHDIVYLGGRGGWVREGGEVLK